MEEDDGFLQEVISPSVDAPPWRFRKLFQLAGFSAALLFLASVTIVFNDPARYGKLSESIQLSDKGIFPLITGGTRRFGEEDEDNFVCVGHVLSAGAWLGAAALKINAAVTSCDPKRYGLNVPEEERISNNRSVRAALCTRDILAHLRDLTQVAQLLEGASTACNRNRVENIKCATAVTNSLRQSFHASRFASELQVYCPEETDVVSLYICINRVEGVGWALDAMLAGIGAAARLCVGKPIEPRADYGSCVGEILGGAAFVAAAGMNIWAGADFECLSAQDPREVLTLTQDEKDRINARCALFAAGAARTFEIAIAKVTEAAGHCGAAGNTACGRSFSLGAAALSGSAESMSVMRLECVSPLSCCTELQNGTFQCDCTAERIVEVREINYIRRGRCARFTSSTLKLLSVAVSEMSEGADECTTGTSSSACASFVGGAMAGFFFLMEAISRATQRCKDPLQRFWCSQDIGFMGESMDTMTHAMGAALRDCGYGNTPRRSNFLSFGRRFFLP
ncbi:unnamed protein product [Durusdinium trenchii]|uniref:Uncharacterized protein n=1 Tax=Durusdinium trenchii TaxID=1381693 RepID=A0ABP0IH27_9DINO